MSLIDEVFAAVPRDQWSGPALTIGAALCAAIARGFPGELPLPGAHVPPARVIADLANRQSQARDARCAAMFIEWRQLRPNDRAGREALAARHGYSSVTSARNALRKWRERSKQEKQGA